MARTRAEIGRPGLPLFNGYLTSFDPNKRLVGREKIRIFREMAYDEPAAVAFLAACRHLLRTDLQVVPGGDVGRLSSIDGVHWQWLQDPRDSIDRIQGGQNRSPVCLRVRSHIPTLTRTYVRVKIPS